MICTIYLLKVLSAYLSQDMHKSFMSIIGYLEFLDYNQMKICQTILNFWHHDDGFNVNICYTSFENLPHHQLQRVTNISIMNDTVDVEQRCGFVLDNPIFPDTGYIDQSLRLLC